jgi:hypothetical protein
VPDRRALGDSRHGACSTNGLGFAYETGAPNPAEKMSHRPFTEFDMERERVLAELREQIRTRLDPVIRHLPQVEKDRLIEQIANFKYRHEGKAALRTTPAREGEIDH